MRPSSTLFQRGTKRAWFWASFAAALGCNAVLGTAPANERNDGPEEDASAIDSASPANDAAPSDGSVADGDDACAGDLSQNPEHCGRCGHSCQGEPCEKGICQAVTIATDLRWPTDVVRSGAYLYVTELGTTENDYRDGRISRVRIDGCTTDCVSIFAKDVEGPTNVAVNEETLFVSRWDKGLSGGSIVQFPISTAKPNTFASNQTRPRTLAFDKNGAALWVNEGLGHFHGAIMRKWLDDWTGTSPEGGTAVIPNLDLPFDLAIDGDDVYYTVAGEDSFGTVHRNEVSGGNDTVLAKDQSQPRRITQDKTFVYWVNNGNGTVHRLAKKGKPTDEELMTGCDGLVDVAVDGTRIYILEYGPGPDYLNGRLRAADHDGKNAVVLGSNLKKPRSLRNGDGVLYFVEQGSAEKGYRDGTVRRVEKP